MKKLNLIFIVLLAVVSCQSQPTTTPNNLIPTLASTPAPNVKPVFDMDFELASADECKSASYDFADFYCKDGEFNMVAKGSNIAEWDTTNMDSGNKYVNYIIQVESRLSGNKGTYGIAFRGNDNPPRFYVFEIRPDGQYQLSIWSQSQGIKVLIPWTASSAINQGESKNTLQVIVQDSYFTLVANDQILAGYSDPTFSSGGAGPIALDEGHAIVNAVKIWQLP